jgi:hypothetical protein
MCPDFAHKPMQSHIGAEHFGNVIVQFSELINIGALLDINRPRQFRDISEM